MLLPEQENNISCTLLEGRSRALVCKAHGIEKESRPQQNSGQDEYLRQKTNSYKVNNNMYENDCGLKQTSHLRCDK